MYACAISLTILLLIPQEIIRNVSIVRVSLLFAATALALHVAWLLSLLGGRPGGHWGSCSAFLGGMAAALLLSPTLLAVLPRLKRVIMRGGARPPPSWPASHGRLCAADRDLGRHLGRECGADAGLACGNAVGSSAGDGSCSSYEAKEAGGRDSAFTGPLSASGGDLSSQRRRSVDNALANIMDTAHGHQPRRRAPLPGTAAAAPRASRIELLQGEAALTAGAREGEGWRPPAPPGPGPASGAAAAAAHAAAPNAPPIVRSGGLAASSERWGSPVHSPGGSGAGARVGLRGQGDAYEEEDVYEALNRSNGAIGWQHSLDDTLSLMFPFELEMDEAREGGVPVLSGGRPRLPHGHG